MTYRETDNLLQWIGAVAIIVGHILNTLGSQYHSDFWNILAFAIGTTAFLLWSIRVANKPQMMVNVVAMTTCTVGLIKALI
jgi:hypothetical protein